MGIGGDGASACGVKIGFLRLLMNPVIEGHVGALTWERSLLGWSSDVDDPSDRAQGRFSYLLDEFIRDYLRVSEGACE